MTLFRPSRNLTTVTAIAVACAWSALASLAAGQAPDNARWVTAWSTSQQVLSESRMTNATVRMIARTTIPGDAVRIRLDSGYGTDPVTIARAYVGQRVRGALLAAGSNRPLTFGGAATVVIPPGGTVWSDPVAL